MAINQQLLGRFQKELSGRIEVPLEDRSVFCDANEITTGNNGLTVSSQHAYVFPNPGGCYIGEVKENKLCGKGKFIYPSGREYVGDWKNDKADGFGTLTLPDGTVFSGKWQDGKQGGKGELIFTNGDRYNGEIGNAQSHYCMHGFGKMTQKSGMIYEGAWDGNSKVGYFIATDRNGCRSLVLFDEAGKEVSSFPTLVIDREGIVQIKSRRRFRSGFNLTPFDLAVAQEVIFRVPGATCQLVKDFCQEALDRGMEKFKTNAVAECTRSGGLKKPDHTTAICNRDAATEHTRLLADNPVRETSL